MAELYLFWYLKSPRGWVFHRQLQSSRALRARPSARRRPGGELQLDNDGVFRGLRHQL